MVPDLIVHTDGSVTKDQSGWRLTVKQWATAIHKEDAACTVQTSSLTMEMEAVTHALRWIAARLSDHIVCHHPTDSMSLLEHNANWDALTGVCQCLAATIEEC